MVKVTKKEGEAAGALLFRFSKRIKQSGVLKEVKKRRFKSRKTNKRKTRLSALYRAEKEKELAREKKYGY